MNLPPSEFHSFLDERLEELAEEEYRVGLQRSIPGARVLGVRVPALRSLAREFNVEQGLELKDWIQFLNRVFPGRLREEILVGAFGLARHISQLDDLFGERVSGWARELDNWECTDQLGHVVGKWVLEDLSRLGYLEAWVVRGENVWKRRLGVVATVPLNSAKQSHPRETLLVLRYAMREEEPTMRKATAWAIRKIKDTAAVENFLSRYREVCSLAFLREATEKLPPDIRVRILQPSP